jgi:gliding motility-associated-like protein
MFIFVRFELKELNMKKILFGLLVLSTTYGFSCSPYLTPLVSHTITPTTIDFQVISTSQWQCCFVFEMELICESANFTGVGNLQPGIEVCKGSGNASSSNWGSEPYPVYSFPIADLCPGVPYKYRVRDRHTGYNYWSEWSAIGYFTIDGDAPTFTLNLEADPPVICAPDCSTLTATPSIGCSPPVFTWNQGLGSGNQQTVCPTENTFYEVTATFNVPYCPSVVQTQSVTIIADVPAVAGSLTAQPLILCQGESTTLTISGQYGDVQWQSANEAAGPFVDIPGATSTTYIHNGTTPGIFYYRVRVNTTCTEEITEIITVEVYDYPQANFNAENVCFPNATIFENTTQNIFPVTSWLWNFGDENTSTQQSPTHSYAPGTYTVTLTATNAGGCPNTFTSTITVYAVPDVSFTATPLEGFEPLIVDFVNTSNGASNYSWNFGDGNSTFGNFLETSHTYENYGVYTVTLSAIENGCSDSATLTIVVIINDISYQIPNVFTPNPGDDVNSYFQLMNPLGFNRVEQFEALILNRWGQVIRTYTNYDFAWDGKDEAGNDVSEGVYFYKLNFQSVEGEIFEEHGFVHLVRP